MIMYNAKDRELFNKSNLIILLDELNNFIIVKNRSGNIRHLKKFEAIDLITKIMFNTFDFSNVDNNILKLFIQAIKKELIGSYNDIFKRYNLKNYIKNKERN